MTDSVKTPLTAHTVADLIRRWERVREGLNMRPEARGDFMEREALNLIAQARSSLSTGEGQELVEAAKALLDGVTRTYKARNGREVSIEADDGEACYIVHSDLTNALRAALAAGSAEG